MEGRPLLALTEQFADLPDPRVERTKLHQLLSILTIVLCAVSCGADSWDEIAAFGEAHRDWFGSSLALPHGIPVHDTFNRVLAPWIRSSSAPASSAGPRASSACCRPR